LVKTNASSFGVIMAQPQREKNNQAV